MFSPAVLFRAPEVNPVNRKARSVPFFNVINMYGRVFFFSWFGFFVAFWSWYAFPPLLHDTIQKDLKLTKIDVANSNIIALCATLLVRLIAGPCCDRFGPRWTFAGTLVIGAIPTFLAGTCYTKSQLFACRFFVGILGGSFVPCQVWSTGFFDKNIVGTSNAIIAGFGNAGGGVTYFLMPTIYDSLVADQGYSPHVAWRITFIVPGVVILTVAAGLFFLCQDTPTGKWADRHLAAQQNLAAHGVTATIVDAPKGVIGDKKPASQDSGSATPEEGEKVNYNATGERKTSVFADHEANMSEQQMLDTARGEVVVKPSPMQIVKVMFSPQVIVLGLCYFFSFGAELAVNSILGTYYQKNFKQLGKLNLLSSIPYPQSHG
jgi:MFS transporter, NNP family, nitrate/nitrite transporter